MIDEKELERVCRSNGLLNIPLAKIPTYRTQKGDAGLELKDGELKSFYFVNGERDYDKIMDEYHICSVLRIFDLYEDMVEDGKKVGEKLKENKENILTMDAVLIPDRLTMPLMEKWKKMSTFERMLMFQKTDPANIEERKGFKKPDGSYEMLKYVKGNFMIQELNIAFLFNWSNYIEEVKETETGYWVRGYITVEADGCSITRAAIGTADKHKGVNSEDVAKAACMDMIKKAASSLGFNSDVYRGEV
jgi:hypothetical protein